MSKKEKAIRLHCFLFIQNEIHNNNYVTPLTCAANYALEVYVKYSTTLYK